MLAVIILLNRQRNPYLRVASLVIAMAVGYLLARAMDMLPADAPAAPTAAITIPTPLYYGPGFDWNLLLPLMLIFMVTSLETIGDITATSDVSEQPVSGPLYEAPEGRRAGQRPELDAVGGVQHLPQLLLRPEQRGDPADRRRQPLRRLRGGADADRAGAVPGGGRLRTAHSRTGPGRRDHRDVRHHRRLRRAHRVARAFGTAAPS